MTRGMQTKWGRPHRNTALGMGGGWQMWRILSSSICFRCSRIGILFKKNTMFSCHWMLACHRILSCYMALACHMICCCARIQSCDIIISCHAILYRRRMLWDASVLAGLVEWDGRCRWRILVPLDLRGLGLQNVMNMWTTCDCKNL